MVFKVNHVRIKDLMSHLENQNEDMEMEDTDSEFSIERPRKFRKVESSIIHNPPEALNLLKNFQENSVIKSSLRNQVLLRNFVENASTEYQIWSIAAFRLSDSPHLSIERRKFHKHSGEKYKAQYRVSEHMDDILAKSIKTQLSNERLIDQNNH